MLMHIRGDLSGWQRSFVEIELPPVSTWNLISQSVIQGGPSGFMIPFVGIKIKVLSEYKIETQFLSTKCVVNVVDDPVLS